MEQRIGFAAVDGRRIAYATVGSGAPLVVPPWWISHVSQDWGTDALRSFFLRLAGEHRVVRFDRLGTGASDRDRPADSYTLDAEVDALAAVADALELERFTLVGISCGACTAARYAVRAPERVRRLVLYGGYADGRRIGTPEIRLGMVDLVRASWGLGARVLTDIFLPDAPAGERAAFAAYQRDAAGRETAARLLELIYGSDVTVDLTAVQAPTTVLHRRADRTIPWALGAEVASLVPGAELVALDGHAHLPWHGTEAQVAATAAAMLGTAPPAAATEGAVSDGALAGLSAREREVLALVASGLTDAQIAAELVLSPHTVHRHVANIRTKLGLASRAAAAAHAARTGLL